MTAYEMRISDWSSDVCSSDLVVPGYRTHGEMIPESAPTGWDEARDAGGNLILANPNNPDGRAIAAEAVRALLARRDGWLLVDEALADAGPAQSVAASVAADRRLIVFRSFGNFRSEEHTSEIKSI